MTATVNGKKLFGAGRFYGINNVSNPTPAKFGLPQDMSVTFKREVKSIFGSKQFAADVASGSMETTFKVTLGTVNRRIFSDLLFGDTALAGQTLEADKEVGTVPAATTYTVQTANHTNWTTDLGVIDADTGKPMTRVAASAEAAGKYSVAAGVYTFAAADANKNVKISYLYTSSSAGETVSLGNQDQGKTGNFTGVFVFPWGTEQDVLTLNSCLASDTELSTKNSDYGKPTFSGMAGCDSSDLLGSFAFAEAA